MIYPHLSKPKVKPKNIAYTLDCLYTIPGLLCEYPLLQLKYRGIIFQICLFSTQ